MELSFGNLSFFISITKNEAVRHTEKNRQTDRPTDRPGWLFGWSLMAFSTQFRSYRAFTVKLYYKY